MKNIEQLSNNIIGQLKGVQRMIEGEKDCYSVLNQMKAIRSALNSMMNKYIEDNFNKCLKNPGKLNNKETLKKLIKEINK